MEPRRVFEVVSAKGLLRSTEERVRFVTEIRELVKSQADASKSTRKSKLTRRARGSRCRFYPSQSRQYASRQIS